MLKIQYCDRRQESVWLVEDVFIIGSNTGCNMVIQAPGVSDHHVEIKSRNNQLSIKPTSTNTTKVNGTPIHTPTLIKATDVITIGDVELEIIDPQATNYQSAIGVKPSKPASWHLRSTASWMEGKDFPIEGRMIIGRESSCGIPIPVEHLSRKHAELYFEGSQLFLRDLNSSNGTFLNGNKIQTSKVNAGDKIKLDVITFEVIGPDHDPNKTIIRSINPKESKSAKPKAGAAKTSATSKLGTKPKTAPRQSPTSVKKKVVADHTGQQTWIKGSKNKEKSNNYIWIAVAGFAITLAAVVLLVI